MRKIPLKRQILAEYNKCPHGNITMKCNICKELKLKNEAEILNQQKEFKEKQEQEKQIKSEKNRMSWIEYYKNEYSKVLPVRYKDCTFENYKNGASITSDIANEIKKDDWNLLFSGTAGCGKTHLASATLKEILDISSLELFPLCFFDYENKDELIYGYDYEKICFNFITMPELLLKIRDAYKSNSSELEAIDKYTNYSVLIIDDLGAEKESEWTIQTFYYILNKRINNIKSTIITTNLTLAEIEKKMNPRIASRLSIFKYFNIKKPDYRKIREKRSITTPLKG